MQPLYIYIFLNNTILHNSFNKQRCRDFSTINRTETARRCPSLYSDKKVPVIRAFLPDERLAEDTMREVKRRAPAAVCFAESWIRPDLQWHYPGNIPPYSCINLEYDGDTRKSEAA